MNGLDTVKGRAFSQPDSTCDDPAPERLITTLHQFGLPEKSWEFHLVVPVTTGHQRIP
jgi:hypothetical protein